MKHYIVDIFGECHTPEERTRVENLIKEHNKVTPYDFLLSEEIGPHAFYTKIGKERGIKNKNFNGSPRSLELSIELGIPIIGIDLWDKEIYSKDTDANKSSSFLLREINMVEIISKFMLKGNCAVIVGDTHLRTVKTKKLGNPSKIITRFSNIRLVTIYRSPIKEI